MLIWNDNAHHNFLISSNDIPKGFDSGTAWEYVFSGSDVVEHVLLVLDWASTSFAARKDAKEKLMQMLACMLDEPMLAPSPAFP
jgi:hypothetical protein